MPTVFVQGRTFDARPDRIDYRDLEYRPRLVSLPPQWPSAEEIGAKLKSYMNEDLILDQGSEGACTGFGLAAVINFLQWRRRLETGDPIVRVSPRMLYNMARVYDEWPGEDYDGSSCRGAMKGWHRHGVCSDEMWPYRDARGRVRELKPKSKWQTDAAHRPLGAYYRIRKDSIVAMQSAIQEVGAVYASADVHEGWFLDTHEKLPTIEYPSPAAGGHAFAIVGYTPDGFIVQNSWGPGWGYCGFALMTYEDWIRNGADAWVAALGAPMRVARSPRTRSRQTLRQLEEQRTGWSWNPWSRSDVRRYDNPAVAPLSEEAAYLHTVVLGNNGRPINRFVDHVHAAEAVWEVVESQPLRWLRRKQTNKLAIYAHGGLNDESASIERIRVMAPYFRANGIYPLFVSWRTGFGESMLGRLQDAVESFLGPKPPELAQGWLERAVEHLGDAKDRMVEVACEHAMVRPVWAQMKQNAGAAAGAAGGLSLMAEHLATLEEKLGSLEIHLVGHSAGSILLGHLLDCFAKNELSVATVSLFAAACTVEFAVAKYARAVRRHVMPAEGLYCDVLSEERERADSVGPYGKSLLYLVSRALEDVHKMPLLGMEGAWSPQVDADRPDLWSPEQRVHVDKWRKLAPKTGGLTVHDSSRVDVWNGREMIRLAHGSFDNDVEVMTKTLERIRGEALATPIESLAGF